MIYSTLKIYMLFIGVSLVCVAPLKAQKLYQQFEKENYSKVFIALEKETPSSISDAGDLKACGTVAMWIGDYKLACQYYEKLEKTDAAQMDSCDYFNYAYCLLETGEEEKLISLSYDDKWVKHIQGVIEFRENVIRNDSFRIDTVDLRYELIDYGISYDGNEVYFSGSKYPYEENNNFENTKLSRRWAEFATIKSFKIGDYTQDSIVGEVLETSEIKSRERFVTNRKDTLNAGYFYTMAPLNGKPEQIIIGGDFPYFPYNSKKYACAMPWYDEANSKLYFCSDVLGGIGGWDIYSCQLEDGEWKEPVNEKVLNTPLNELFPHTSPWGLIFASNAQKGLGGFDNYLYSSDSSKVVNLVEFNTDNDDYSLEIVMKFDTLVAIGISDAAVLAYIYHPQPKDPNDTTSSGDELDMDDPIVNYGDNDEAYLLPGNLPKEDTVIEEPVVDTVPPVKLNLALFYGMDKYELTDKNKVKVDTFIERLQRHVPEGSTIILTGSADGVGTVRYNDLISYQRSSTLVQYIEENIGDFNITFKQLVLGQLSDKKTDSCMIRRAEAIIPPVFPMDESVFYRYRNTEGLSLSEVADLFHNDIEQLRELNETDGTEVKDEVFVAIKEVIRARKGTTLYIIAKEYGCTVKELVKINKKKNDQVIEKEVLVIPIKNK